MEPKADRNTQTRTQRRITKNYGSRNSHLYSNIHPFSDWFIIRLHSLSVSSRIPTDESPNFSGNTQPNYNFWYAVLRFVWEFRKQQSRTFAVDTRRLQPDELVADTNKNPETNLQSKLVKMLGGDTAAAQRLIEQSRQDYPAMPENWYWERAIADLERDRR